MADPKGPHPLGTGGDMPASGGSGESLIALGVVIWAFRGLVRRRRSPTPEPSCLDLATDTPLKPELAAAGVAGVESGYRA